MSPDVDFRELDLQTVIDAERAEARREALEEAAKVCERVADGDLYEFAAVAESCAAAIRALISQEPSA